MCVIFASIRQPAMAVIGLIVSMLAPLAAVGQQGTVMSDDFHDNTINSSLWTSLCGAMPNLEPEPD